jgi:hypothetical protein
MAGRKEKISQRATASLSGWRPGANSTRTPSAATSEQAAPPAALTSHTAEARTPSLEPREIPDPCPQDERGPDRHPRQIHSPHPAETLPTMVVTTMLVSPRPRSTAPLAESQLRPLAAQLDDLQALKDRPIRTRRRII